MLSVATGKCCVTRNFETAESLEQRLKDAEEALQQFEQMPGSANVDILAKAIYELDVMIDFFRREDVLSRIRYLVSRSLDRAIYQYKFASKIAAPVAEQVFEVPELHDIETRIYACDACKKGPVVIRILNSKRTIRTPYKCKACNFVGMAKILPQDADAILRNGKVVDCDHMVLNKQKRRQAEPTEGAL
jgi:hypothetical protein